jgi:hypothetical protein
MQGARPRARRPRFTLLCFGPPIRASGLQVTAHRGLKNPERRPFGGCNEPGAASTIQSRHKRDTYEAARKSFARTDHERFTDCVIASAAS